MLALSWVGSVANAADVDSAIVFAVDVSLSVDPDTADLQREGHAEAIRSPEIVAAISRNPLGCIAIAYLEWSSPGRTRTVLPWTTICGSDDAEAVALMITERGDRGRWRDWRARTSISSAIDAGAALLDGFEGNAARKVIDISGNGANNDGPPVEPSRRLAMSRGYVINAIVIPTLEEGDITPYFAAKVIGGPQAFLVTPLGLGDYTTTLRRKLVIEISLQGGLADPARRAASKIFAGGVAFLDTKGKERRP